MFHHKTTKINKLWTASFTDYHTIFLGNKQESSFQRVQFLAKRFIHFMRILVLFLAQITDKALIHNILYLPQ